MAEAIAILGVAAAALQFAETGYKVISRCSSLMKRSREYPDYIHRTHSQMQHLIYLAKVAADIRDTPQVVASSESQPAVGEHLEEQSQTANNQPVPAATISIQMETIWKDCAHQAEVIDNVLQSIMREIEGRGLIGKWKQLSLHERVYSIERALGELERSKTTLGLWLGNESLYRMGRMHHDLAMMHNQILQSERTLSRMFEEYHRKTENMVLTVTQPKPPVNSLGAKIDDQEDENTKMIRRAPSVVIPNPSNQDLISNKAKSSGTERKIKDIDHNIALLPNVMKVVEWTKMLAFAGNMVILQLGSQGKRSHTFTSEDDKNMFLDVYIRLRMTWLFDLVELNFSLQQYSGNPSIRASLRTQIRVRSLPLEGLFDGIYEYKECCRSRGLYRIPTQEEQLHLFFVARKFLLANFYSGNAFPNAIDTNGETLLHLQAELYRSGYETLFTKMTEFLLSMGVDAEVVNDDFQTAQNILFDKLFIHGVYTHESSYNVATDSRLTWTGSLEKQHFERRTLRALEILQCIRHWPEAILDIEYGQICDIVLRKSIGDLQKLPGHEDLNSVQRDKSISPLHFAAAASWPAGVETLISMGYSRFQKDYNGDSPLGLAVDAKCISAVETLLKGNCQALFALNTLGDVTFLPQEFLKAARTDDAQLHDVIVECLTRHKFLLPGLFPYHDLPSQPWFDRTKFAQKLFLAGFQDIDAYNSTGETPLMVTCSSGNLRMASFLLQHGADPFKCHEYIGLRAGHFLCYGALHTSSKYWTEDSVGLTREDGIEFSEDEKRLLEAAFDTSIEIESRCRCSPDGASPITFLFQRVGGKSICFLKESFQRMIRNVYCSPVDMRRYWRAFVLCETFNRLGMTHTCLKLESPGRLFPDNERIEIEDEEEELFFELEEVVARFDLFSENRNDDLSKCVDEFFDDLDGDLRPRRLPVSWKKWEWNHRSPGCLGPGESFSEETYLSSGGKEIKYAHKEIVEEESMLRWLFP